MNLRWETDSQNIDWDELSMLYEMAPLGTKHPSDLKLVFNHSLYKYFVYYQDKLIGVGRALADGLDCSYICDVAVHPDYQGKGIGKQIISRLIDASKGHKKILLYAVPGKEAFYAQFGFKKMKTAMAIFENPDQAITWGLIEDERQIC